MSLLYWSDFWGSLHTLITNIESIKLQISNNDAYNALKDAKETLLQEISYIL